MTILQRRDENAVAYLTMNSPERLNALSDEMLTALQTNLDSLHDDTSIRAKFMQSIQKVPQPVIAQVHGIATAAGCQLVASCDLAIAAEGARFGVNGVNIGLFCSTPMVALSRNISRKRAFELLVTGEFMHASEAKDAGLINRVVPEVDLGDVTKALAEGIAVKLASAIKIGKTAYYQQIQMPLDQAYAYTGDVMVQNMLNLDTKEGIAAFMEKRDPKWSQD